MNIGKPEGMSDFAYKIMLDRYSEKNHNGDALLPGDIVIAIINSSKGDMRDRREVAQVIEKLGDGEYIISIYPSGEEMQMPVGLLEKPLETSPEQIQKRVAKGISQVEKEREVWEENFLYLLKDWKFVPGGRILTAAGTDQDLSAYNCFVLDRPKDSRQGIIDTLSQMMELMSRGGGVGINVSSLRPKGSYVKGVNGRSSGAVSFGDLYSFGTGLIQQAGCFSAEERIGTNKGLVKARDLYDRMILGEEFSAHTHKGQRNIVDQFSNGIKEVYEVRTERGFCVKTTLDHKFGVLSDGRITTTHLRYLQVGDEILILLGEGTDGLEYVKTEAIEQVHPETLNEDFAYLLGYAYGDGYVMRHNGKAKALNLSTSDNHPAIQEKLTQLIEKLFGLKASVRQGKGSYKSIVMYSVAIMGWLERQGLLKEKSEEIRVPEAIFKSPTSVMNSFIAGYFDADGCNRGSKGGYGIDSTSLVMLQDVQKILAFNGILSHISRQRGDGKWKKSYRLIVSGAGFRRLFGESVPAFKVSKSDNGQKDTRNNYPSSVLTLEKTAVDSRVSIRQVEIQRNRMLECGEIETAKELNGITRVMPDSIKSIEFVGLEETYDFEVEDAHLLSGGGIYTSNSRRGALMLILDDWHPDIASFINAKRESGKITNANISVGISDRFMECVKKDEIWRLYFPDTSHPDYDKEWTGDLEEWVAKGLPVTEYGKPHNHNPEEFITVPNGKPYMAREIWDMIIDSAWASAEPGLWFRDRTNKLSNSYYYPEGKLICTNPCVTGDTRLYTDKGLIRMVDLFDDETEFEAVIDGRFGLEKATAPSTRVFRTGTKPVFELRTKEGYKVKATADHRFMTPYGWVKLQDLKAGDSIHILNRKGGFGQEGDLNLGRLIGWFVGDGTITTDKRVSLEFFEEEKKELAQSFANYANENVSISANNRECKIGVLENENYPDSLVRSTRLYDLFDTYGLIEKKLQVPEVVFRGTEDMQRGYLQALFSSDGTVLYNAKNQAASIRLTSVSESLLEETQMLLSNFGIASRIYRYRRDAGYRKLPDGNGGLKEYWCKAQHELAISGMNVQKFSEEINFMLKAKSEKLKTVLASHKKLPRTEKFTAKVESITPAGTEDVYDITQLDTHSTTVNGVITHNCGEEPLPAYAVCNLGAINLSRFWDKSTKSMNWNDLGVVVRYAVRFLDDVIDWTPYHFEQNRKQQMSERRIGLGIMGLGDLLIRLGIRYGSDEAVAFTDKIFKYIAENAYSESADIALEKGPFPKYKEALLESGYMQQLKAELPEVWEKVKRQGLRNVTLLTIAPTGTTGSMLETTTGIEPAFALKWERQGRLGKHIEYLGLAKEWLEENGEPLPDYFVTAMELTPMEHVKMQAAAQRWVDAAISKTCNAPNDYTKEQTSELYLALYDLGAKGGTIYRDGSRSEQVLNLIGDKNEESAHVETSEDTDEVSFPIHPESMSAKLIRGRTPHGSVSITIAEDPENSGIPFAVYITIGKSGSDLHAQAEAIGRLISKGIQAQKPSKRLDMLKVLAEQLRNIGGARSLGLGPNKTTSLPDTIGKMLLEKYINKQQVEEKAAHALEEHIVVKGANYCPECQELGFIKADGCTKCMVCGYSEC